MAESSRGYCFICWEKMTDDHQVHMSIWNSGEAMNVWRSKRWLLSL